MKKKILHYLWSGQWGGAERCVRDIALYSNPERFEHHIFFCASGGPLYDQMKAQGLNVYLGEMKNGFDFFKGLNLFRIIKIIRPDIINVHLAPFLLYVIFLFFPSIKKVYFEHGGLFGMKTKRHIFFYKYIAKVYDLILANSLYIKDSILSINSRLQNKVKTYYIGVDIKKYQILVDNEKLKQQLKLPSSKKIVGIIGRLVEQKGIDDFIKIADIVFKIRKDICFIIIGDGELRQSLEYEANLTDADIRFLGARSDIPELIHLLDIFLFTSKWEPFGIVLLEAIAAGVPIVGFSLPGAKEIIDICGGGILLETRSHEHIVEVLCSQLDTNNSIINSLVLEKVKQEFDISKTVSNFENIYQSVLAN